MKFYAYDKNGLLVGEVSGFWDPLAKKYSPKGNSTPIAPPELQDKKTAHWDGEKWSIVDDVHAIQAEYEANYSKLRHRSADDVALFKMGSQGQIIPKSEAEIKQDTKALKQDLALEQAAKVIEANLLDIVKILAKDSPEINKFLVELDTIVASVDANTELESLEWPTL